MRTIEIDFDVFKAITARRTSEDVSENDVMREVFGLAKSSGHRRNGVPEESVSGKFWLSEGVRFPVGMILDHTFRDGRMVVATIVENGVLVDGKVHGGLSPAGTAVAGYQLNGWRFWGLRSKNGKWVTADSLRG